MNPITRRDVLAHQTAVPWPSLRQVEQDLLLCHCMAALFDDKFLREQIAMRGGTLLHKVHLAPAARYSEDIDLVAIGKRPGKHIEVAIRRVLRPLLGQPVRSTWDNIKLAIRNITQPSKVLRLTYSIRPVADAGTSMDIVVEVNVTERKPHRPIVRIPFEFSFQDAKIQTTLNGYDIHEMLGTKMRALFQRRRGRDLFDLYWALAYKTANVKPSLVVESFLHYLHAEGSRAGRGEFMTILDSHLADRGFCADMTPLLRADLSYDPQRAGKVVRERLLKLLPE